MMPIMWYSFKPDNNGIIWYSFHWLEFEAIKGFCLDEGEMMFRFDEWRLRVSASQNRLVL